jgi:hypothetical protein
MSGGVLARRGTSLGGGGTSLEGLGGARTSQARPLVSTSQARPRPLVSTSQARPLGSTPALPLVSTLPQNETETEKEVERAREAEKEKEREGWKEVLGHGIGIGTGTEVEKEMETEKEVSGGEINRVVARVARVGKRGGRNSLAQ